MKKNLLCAIFFLASTVAMAQVWCPPGAKWHFKRGAWYSNSGINGDLDLTYTADTTLLGTPCKKMVAVYTGQIWVPTSPAVTQNFNTYYTYQNNKVIFLYNATNAVFDTVVNFNAAIGDKWLRPGANVQPNGCSDRWAFTVVDTDQVNINGFNLKRITTTYTYAASSTVITYTNVFLERILFTGGGYLEYYNLFPTYCQGQSVILETPATTFRCYEDSLFPTYNAIGGACKDFWTSINNQALNNLGFTAYPNPTDNSLTLEISDAGRYEMKLADLLGNLWPLTMLKTGENRMQADLSRFEPGVYFIRVYEKGRPVGVEKIVKK